MMMMMMMMMMMTISFARLKEYRQNMHFHSGSSPVQGCGHTPDAQFSAISYQLSAGAMVDGDPSAT